MMENGIWSEEIGGVVCGVCRCRVAGSVSSLSHTLDQGLISNVTLATLRCTNLTLPLVFPEHPTKGAKP